MNDLLLRPVKMGDAREILAIYTPYILETTVTFEVEVPSPEDFAARVRAISARYPFLVCQDGERLAGYAYAAPHQKRAAYRWNVSLSIYMRPEYCGMGLGRGLYGVLVALVERMGYQNLYAEITLPNEASMALHAKLGFTELAVQRKCGCKFGRWLDVAILEKQVGPYRENPPSPLSIRDVPSAELTAVLARRAPVSTVCR